MPYLYVRGQQDPVEITKEDAEIVKRALDTNKPFSTVISLTDSSWKLSEIKGIDVKKEGRGDKSFEEIQIKIRQERIDFLKLSIEDKVRKSIPHFDLFHWSMLGERPNEEMIKKAKDKIREFFENNKNWTLPSLKIYQSLIPKFKGTETLWRQSGIKCLEEQENSEIKKVGICKLKLKNKHHGKI